MAALWRRRRTTWSRASDSSAVRLGNWMTPVERAWRIVFNGRVANIAAHIGRYSELLHVFDDNSLTVNSLR